MPTNHLNIVPAFANGGYRTRAASAASDRAIHYTIAPCSSLLVVPRPTGKIRKKNILFEQKSRHQKKSVTVFPYRQTFRVLAFQTVDRNCWKKLVLKFEIFFNFSENVTAGHFRFLAFLADPIRKVNLRCHWCHQRGQMLLCRSLSAGQLKVLGSNPAVWQIFFQVFILQFKSS